MNDADQVSLLSSVALVLLGGFLGLFSNIFVETYRNSQKRGQARNALISELDSLKVSMLGVAIGKAEDIAALNPEFFEWFDDETSGISNKRSRDALKQISELKKQQIQQQAEGNTVEGRPLLNLTFGVSAIHMSHSIANMSLMDTKTQTLINEIYSNYLAIETMVQFKRELFLALAQKEVSDSDFTNAQNMGNNVAAAMLVRCRDTIPIINELVEHLK